MRRIVSVPATAGAASFILAAAVWSSSAQTPPSPAVTKTAIPGQAIPGLTDSQQNDFTLGLQKFSTVETPPEGLGPVFNGTTCAECHKAGAIGGAGLDLSIARVRRIGAFVNGRYTDLPEVGGPVLQARSLREFDTSCPVQPEIVPRQAQFLSLRITTPLFGAGLIEAIPDAAILQRTQIRDPDGIHGAANIFVDPETGQNAVGRFGWKAQAATLHFFSGDAYLNEMGIVSASFPTKNLPQGQPIPAGYNITGDLDEHNDDVTGFTNFMRLLAPLAPRLTSDPRARASQDGFNSLRCGACHVPMMTTGPNSISALSNQPVPLYSDLLLHQMGAGLADGIHQGAAGGDQWRTAPLWGLSRRLFFLHDGRASTYADAILAHGGEATPARQRFQSLRPQDRDNLLAFLATL